MIAQSWQTGDAPKDRPIIIVGSIRIEDDFTVSYIPVCCEAQWSEKCGEWLNSDGMTIRRSTGETLTIHHWIDLPAGSGPEVEVTAPAFVETQEDGSHVQVHGRSSLAWSVFQGRAD